MSRSNYPSAIEFVKSEIKLDDEMLREPLSILRACNREEAGKVIFEWINQTSAAKKAVGDQDIKTTPRTVIKLIDELENATAPFIDPRRGLDADTYDLLEEDIKKVRIKIKERKKQLDFFQINAGSLNEVRNFAATLAKKIFEKYSEDKSESRMRSFVSLLLDIAEFEYSDPIANPGRFDQMFIDLVSC